jgi:uncharacterized protein with gpF-like domain
MLRKDEREAKAFGFGLDEKWIAAIVRYFQQYLLNKAVLPISATIKQHILNILTEGEKQGWGIDKMASFLREPELPMFRARMIARTEISKAQFYGNQLAEQESQWEVVNEWLSVHDGRTRHSHREVDTKKVHAGQRFRVNRYRRGMLIGIDFMLGPGDPDASAENVINCRCTLAPRLARDKNGILIRKNIVSSKISVILPNQRSNIMQVVTI